MLDKDTEPFSNPLAPSNQEVQKVVQSSSQETDQNAQPLTNDDFRKLMMTPRPMSSALGLMSVRSEYPASVRGSVGSRKPILKQEINENKKKKKKFYAAIKKQDEDTLAELAAKYRDRAKERRDGHNPDYQNEDPMSGIAAYRAVAPDVKSVVDAAVRRKQMIEESKFLGGDMAHTHLVKGLDYALLQKVKAENQDDDDEDEEEMEELEQIKDKSKAPDMKEENEEDIWLPKSILAKNIINTLTKAKLPEKQELFLPGRMAYIVDLEDECADDIPTTVIRSKADCPNWDSITTLSTNDIVINKLTQILSYLRYGGGHKKKKKEKIPFIEDTIKEKSKEKKKEDLSDSIYGDIGDYVPSFGKEKNKRDEMKDKERRSRGYFEKPSYSDDIPSTSKNRLIKEEKDKNHKPLLEDVQLKAKLSSKLDNNAPESYAGTYFGYSELFLDSSKY